VPVEINLIIDTDTLDTLGTEPALLNGVPIPADTTTIAGTDTGDVAQQPLR
jgi:hypothetical protein